MCGGGGGLLVYTHVGSGLRRLRLARQGRERVVGPELIPIAGPAWLSMLLCQVVPNGTLLLAWILEDSSQMSRRLPEELAISKGLFSLVGLGFRV